MNHDPDCPYLLDSDDTCECLTDEHGILTECNALNDPDECRTLRERLVAGTNAPIPDCPIHGEWTDETKA